LLDECFRVAGRTTWYLEPEEIQRDLDRFLEYYNLQRRHQGYRLGGHTPAQALQAALGLSELPPLGAVEGGEVTAAGAESSGGRGVGRCLNVNSPERQHESESSNPPCHALADLRFVERYAANTSTVLLHEVV